MPKLIRPRPLLIAALLVAVAGCTTTTSPTGRRQVMVYSDAEIARQGEEIYREMQREMRPSGNRREINYVQCVTDHVLAAMDPADRNRYHWEITVFDDDSANAFALPGGKMGVLNGLLTVAENQHQLAAVIAHEVGHVLANHGNEDASRSTLVNLGLLAAQILGAPAEAVELLDTGALLGITLPYSREQEREADAIGVILMADAGFDPAQSITLWQNMSADDNGDRPPEFLSSHPSPASRMQELAELLPPATALKESARGRGRKPNCKLN